jgi:hypothetical protein
MNVITIVDDFSKSPYGRDKSDNVGPEDFSGEKFRETLLVKSLENNDKTHVILDGYNRYGRSFLDEAFGGLIRVNKYTKAQLDEKLIYSHSLVKSIELLITSRIESAENDRVSNDEDV